MAEKPQMLVSTDPDDGTRDRENRQYEKRYEIDYAAYRKRVVHYALS